MATSNIKGNIVYSMNLGVITPTSATIDAVYQEVFDKIPSTERAVIGTFFYDGWWAFFGAKYQNGTSGGFVAQKLITTYIEVVSVHNGVLTHTYK